MRVHMHCAIIAIHASIRAAESQPKPSPHLLLRAFVAAQPSEPQLITLTVGCGGIGRSGGGSYCKTWVGPITPIGPGTRQGQLGSFQGTNQQLSCGSCASASLADVRTVHKSEIHAPDVMVQRLTSVHTNQDQTIANRASSRQPGLKSGIGNDSSRVNAHDDQCPKGTIWSNEQSPTEFELLLR